MPMRMVGGRLVQVPSFEFPPVESEAEVLTTMEVDNTVALRDILRDLQDGQIDRADALRRAFGGFVDLKELLRHYDVGSVGAFLEATLGSPDDVRSAISEMPPEQVARTFDTPIVHEIVQQYSQAGEGGSD